MKLSKYILLTTCIFCVLSAFGQEKEDKDKDLYDFAVPVVEGVKSEKTEIVKKEEIKKEEPKIEKDAKEASLIADAQTLIRDKLIQKYQLRLDEVIDRLSTKLGTVSPESERVALSNLRKTMGDRKTLVEERKDLEPTKKDIIIAILNHVISRVDGLIKQSATQTDDQKVRA